METEQQHRLDCRRWSRYLLGVEPTEEMCERYVAAQGKLLGEKPDVRSRRVLHFARNHAWSVGMLDAACCWIDGENELRKRLLILTAILEASPVYADRFLPPEHGAARIGVELALLGAKAMVKRVAGVLLYAAVIRRWWT